MPVAKLSDLDDGEILPVTAADGAPVCLVRVGDEICALLDNCSHQNFPLSSGAVLPDGSLECAWHGARFDARTGAPLGLPAVEAVPTYDVAIDGDTILLGGRRNA
jgi:3-phenylpropionate/trans-cinnamate dioxygenase ferredoxin component